MKIGLKKKDFILIVIVILVADSAYLFHQMIGEKSANCVTVKVGGRLNGVYSLSEDRDIEINRGSNLLRIKNGTATMIEADCPDKLCVHQKSISKDHESIICLPNRVIVEVDSNENSQLDAVTN